MRKSKVYAQAVKRIMRPEVSHCLQCQRRLQQCVTISQRTVVTLWQVINLVHCGYRRPVPDCPGRKQLYRCAQADALALPGFTFGLDIVILVGQLRLREHKTGTAMYCGMAGVSPIKSGGSINLMGMLVCKLAYSTWRLPLGGRSAKRQAPIIKNSSTAIAFVISH